VRHHRTGRAIVAVDFLGSSVDIIMLFLRILSFFAGSFVLLGSPFLLLGDQSGTADAGTLAVLVSVLAIWLFAAAYFFFAVFGHRTSRSSRARRLALGLIAFQLAAGAWLLATSHLAKALVAAAPLLCFTVFLFMAFIWPGESARSHRPMRRRERIDELQHW
jgi:hypothetical protein